MCVFVGWACGAQPIKPTHIATDARNQAQVLIAAPQNASNQPMVATPQNHAQPSAVAAVRPKLEVVFVLDTTGSMANLLDGAKAKIWTIADELASAQPSPELRIGLIAYRDRGDTYVTKRFPLTDDIDTIYQQLYSLHADGGGDTPESVNQALHEAVHDTPWSQEASVYRAVFLVGDAPPHMDYRDDVPYRHTSNEARERGIVINTVQCGDLEGTKPVWLAISDKAKGTYAAIAQDGGMQHIAAPMDAEIGRLNAALAETAVPYGDSAMREKTQSKVRMAASAPAAASASRRAYLSKKGDSVVTGGGDLLDDVASGRARLETMSSAELPEEYRSLNNEERKQKLAQKKAERAQLQGQLDELVRQRAVYVGREQQKREGEGAPSGFDGEVMKTVKAQAAERTGAKY
jgi:hypothetical protein